MLGKAQESLGSERPTVPRQGRGNTTEGDDAEYSWSLGAEPFRLPFSGKDGPPRSLEQRAMRASVLEGNSSHDVLLLSNQMIKSQQRAA